MSSDIRKRIKLTATGLFLIIAGAFQGYMLGQASAHDDCVDELNEIVDSYEPIVEFYESEHALVRNNSAYFRLEERTDILYRILEASDQDVSYETLVLDVGADYRELLERASQNLPETLHERDAIRMELARGMADRLRSMAEERAAREADSGS